MGPQRPTGPMGPAQQAPNAFEALRNRAMPGQQMPGMQRPPAMPGQQMPGMRPGPSMPGPAMSDPMMMTQQGMAGGGTMAGPSSGFGFDYMQTPRRR